MIIDETRDCKNCYCHLVCAIYNPYFDNYAPECNLYMGEEDCKKVVRCCDCIYCISKNGYLICSATTNPNFVHLEHFCSYGERKD